MKLLPWPSPGRARVVTATLALVAALVAVLPVPPAPAARARASTITLKRVANPDRTLAYQDGRLIATFTLGARSVTLAGASRRFHESSASHAVTTTTWVRLLERPFAGRVDLTWLARARADTSPDVLALGMQYVRSAPVIADASGRRIAGDASYGPLLADGTREEGSDFNDYLGVTWDYGTTQDAAEARQLWSLDCSGFVRMVYGYRLGVPLSLQATAGALPRRARDIASSGPGVVIVGDAGAQVTTFRSLAAGDLVFFDAAADDGTAIDHVGVYLGRDAAGHHRFLSSRKTPDGPTLGDEGARSVLDGTGYYARSFRAVRRL